MINHYPARAYPGLCLFLLLGLPGVGVVGAQTGAWQVIAGTHRFQVELAFDNASRQRGLMHRVYLAPTAGLLMRFPRPAQAPVWMKNVRIPLDVVWIDDQGYVVDRKTLPVCQGDPCPSYYPKAAARFVLEVNAHHFPLDIGDRVEIMDAGGESRIN